MVCGRVTGAGFACLALLAALAAAAATGDDVEANAGAGEAAWPAVEPTSGAYTHPVSGQRCTVALYSSDAALRSLYNCGLHAVLGGCLGHPFCKHQLCHNIGEALFRINNTNLPLECASHCVGGCLHGFIESYYNKYALALPLAQLHLLVEGTCDVLPPELHGNCLHGMAHGLFTHLARARALDVCERLSTHAKRLACGGGVWMMEYPKMARLEDVPLCEQRDPLGCFTYAPMARPPQDVPLALDECFEWYGTAWERRARNRLAAEAGLQGAVRRGARDGEEEAAVAGDAEVRKRQAEPRTHSLGHNDTYALEGRKYLLPCVYGALQAGIQRGDHPLELCVPLPTQAQRFACIDGWTRRERLFMDMEAECNRVFAARAGDADAGGDEQGGEGRMLEPITAERREEMRARCVSRAVMTNHDTRENWDIYEW